MSIWQSWADEQDGEEPVVWCLGWSEDRESLALALYRLGYSDRMGVAYGLAEEVDLIHGVIPAWVLDEPDMQVATITQMISDASLDRDDDAEPHVAITLVHLS